jgi:D-alanine-D-alanine ligase
LPEINSFPLVVKPYACGSSLGVSIVQEKSDLKKALEDAFLQQGKVLLETYIGGREITVGILDQEPLAVVEIVPKSGYYDFNAKYKDQETEFIVPAEISGKIYNNCQSIALAAHKALGCRDFSRVDIRLSEAGVPYVLEVNSIPGLTAHSLLPLSADASGVSFEELIRKMLHLALSRKVALRIN